MDNILDKVMFLFLFLILSLLLCVLFPPFFCLFTWFYKHLILNNEICFLIVDAIIYFSTQVSRSFPISGMNILSSEVLPVGILGVQSLVPESYLSTTKSRVYFWKLLVSLFSCIFPGLVTGICILFYIYLFF